MRLEIVGLLACAAAVGCTKASDEHARAMEATRYETGYRTLAAAAPPGDSLAVLLRFDHLQEHGLADQVDALMKIMPDHRRVFGGGGDIAPSFDLVYISTAEATSATASTLIARSLKPRAELEAMLAYPNAGVTWSDSPAGRLGGLSPTPWLEWMDPRAYLIASDPWIVLTNPKNLGAMLEGSPGKQPAWLRAIPSLVTLTGPDRDSDLLAIASTDDLPATARLPGVGQVTMPTSMLAAATANGGVVTLSGDMTFTSEAHARAAEKALAALRKQFGAFHAVRDLTVRRKGAALYWRTTATTRDVAMMTGLATNAVRPLFDSGPARGWHYTLPPDAVLDPPGAKP
ncbi:MAG TPA: hypothetical protein VML75_17880 [Kofleriaceae bacterium]|nr:hypothetical protein [Kofleriaceae bacterium]